MRKYFRAAGYLIKLVILGIPATVAATPVLADETWVVVSSDPPRTGIFFWINIASFIIFAIILICYGSSISIWMKSKGILHNTLNKIFFWIIYVAILCGVYVGVPYLIPTYDGQGADAIWFWYSWLLFLGPAVIALVGILLGRIHHKPFSKSTRLTVGAVVTHVVLIGIYVLASFIVSARSWYG